MDVEWCGVLVTPPPKYHTFSVPVKITVVSFCFGRFITALEFLRLSHIDQCVAFLHNVVLPPALQTACLPVAILPVICDQ